MYVPLPYHFRSLSRPSSPLRALGIPHAPLVASNCLINSPFQYVK